MSIRINNMTSNYSQIAILHYWQAKRTYGYLLTHKEMSDKVVELECSILNDSIVVVTFAAMALESFLNDFAATNMGDKFFYENFDMLRPMGKMKLITRFILKSELSNGSKLYNLVDGLFRTRNNFVHSKSKDGSRYAMTEEEYWKQKDDNEREFFKSSTIDFSSSKEILQTAFYSLCALREVGIFFDSHNIEPSTLSMLLFSKGCFSFDITVIEHIKEVQKELGIPTLL